MPAIWAVANHKGGIGKTTVTVFLAEALVGLGRKVLVVDVDPQASATKLLGTDTATVPTMADLLLGDEAHSVEEVTQSTEWGFGFAPSHISLAERETRRSLGDEFLLRRALAEVPGYDVVLVDCPPSLGLLTVNALSAANRVLVVIEPSFVTLQAVNDVLGTLEVVREHYNAMLALGGVVVNLMDHTREARARAGEAAAFFAEGTVWEPCVPRRTVLREAASAGVGLGRMGIAGAEVADVFARLADKVVAQGG